MSAKISKCLCRNLFVGAAAQIRAVYKDHEILEKFEKVYFVFKFLDLQHQISIVLWLSYLRKHFSFIWRLCKYEQGF